ncbi:MAG TPA: IPT/TIG domain-containing protein [Longimicrobiales bacterium]
MLSFRARRSVASVLVALASISCSDGTEPTGNPTPVIASISPASVASGGDAIEITILGSGFVEGSRARVDGVERPAALTSPTEIRMTLLATDREVSGEREVTVSNPTPGGGTSNAVLLVVQEPAPVTVTALEPDSLMTGADSAVLVVRGSGFGAADRILIGTVVLSPRSWSADSAAVVLDSTLLREARAEWVHVGNAVGLSTPISLTIYNPVPVLAGISPASVPAGIEGLEVVVSGHDLRPQTVVLVDGEPRETLYRSDDEVAIELSQADLNSARVLELEVSSPAPGGGTASGSATFIVEATPVIETLPSFAANSGGGGFELRIHGRNFTDGSVVRWNGSPRATTFLSDRRLVATITAADLAATTEAAIAVANPGDVVSPPVAFSVRPFATPALASHQTVEVPAWDLVWHEALGRLIASVRGDSTPLTASLIVIDPITGAITDTARHEFESFYLALSDDGSVLYASQLLPRQVVRFSVADWEPDLTIGLWPDVAASLAVLPGSPGSLAVARRDDSTCCPPWTRGVALYDDGVMRGTSSESIHRANQIVFADRFTLFGLDNASSYFGFRTMKVESGGLAVVRSTDGMADDYYARIRYAAGRVYVGAGEVIDAERHELLGSFTEPEEEGTVLPLPEEGRAIFISRSGELRIHDLNTFEPLGGFAIPGWAAEPVGWVAAVRCGDDRIAVTDGHRIHLIGLPSFR